ncbi:MAG: enoyl-CoA hydratase/isomerase family protein [Lautropia sp.]|nr:MAG: enoyl-CoA hydratase/isomerase family protein [Pseudomonadota bacterium]MBC6959569.1 enoyl-CoA hydratase/isomerase family protein [Lautropia sp.]MDL1906612.1 enoyl-CoA hydratase/isomerase family protein [Betaproteobacteria bacterium PRO1]RIK90940.1 MAG: enoyl-CoA hydratase/isomerase family protein [Burkholderiales bacterium]
MASRSVKVVGDGHVGRIHLNRPHVRNAFDRSLIEELAEAARWLDRQRQVKVVVVSGEGRSFCSGFDLKQFSETSVPEDVREVIDAGRQMVETIARMRAITIASVQGSCVGGGILLVLACDFRFAGESAEFFLPETDLGIPLAWGGVPWLIREIGPAATADLILSCRRVTAAEALGLRLLNAVHEDGSLVEQVDAYAQRLCRHAAIVLETTKAQIAAARRSLAPDHYTFCDAHLAYSALRDREAFDGRSKHIARDIPARARR